MRLCTFCHRELEKVIEQEEHYLAHKVGFDYRFARFQLEKIEYELIAARFVSEAEPARVTKRRFKKIPQGYISRLFGFKP